MSRLKLKVLNTSLAGTELTLEPPGGVLGRRRDVELCLRHVGLSGQHVRFQWEAARGWLVSDAGSTNGTWLSGVRLDGVPKVLGAGAELSCADLELRVWTEPLVSALPVESAPETMVYGVSLFQAAKAERVDVPVDANSPAKPEPGVRPPSTRAGVATELLELPERASPERASSELDITVLDSASWVVPVEGMPERVPPVQSEPKQVLPVEGMSERVPLVQSEPEVVSVRPKRSPLPGGREDERVPLSRMSEPVRDVKPIPIRVEVAPETEELVVNVVSAPSLVRPVSPPPRLDSERMPEGQALRALVREGRALADALGETLEFLAHGLSTGVHREKLEQTLEEASLRLADFRSRLEDGLGGTR
ncbi:MAG: FHA domain-containing protein [Myxococcota bacterium]